MLTDIFHLAKGLSMGGRKDLSRGCIGDKIASMRPVIRGIMAID